MVELIYLGGVGIAAVIALGLILWFDLSLKQWNDYLLVTVCSVILAVFWPCFFLYAPFWLMSRVTRYRRKEPLLTWQI